ncbi:hypothetical protein GBAR_LOCUS6788, partial [Geodia barretti]
MSTEDTRRLLCSLAWLRGLGGNGKLLGDVKFLSTHLALIDALMRAYVLAVVKIPHVMRVVRYVCN